MDKIIAESLHPLERKTLPHLKKYSHFDDIVKHSKLKAVEVMRALQWLENKDLIKLTHEKKEVVELDQNGKEYSINGLPEIRLLKVLSDNPIKADVAREKAKIKPEEMSISLGTLRSKAAIKIEKGKYLMLSITQVGKKIREKPSLEEIFLSKKFPLDIQNLSPEERHSLIELKKRKSIIKVETLKKTFASLTKKGLDITKISLDTDVIDRLTPEMLKTGSWKKKQFRRYDVEINVPESHGGKRHFVDSATEYARRIWLDMGFKEMSGTFVQTSFWNFDALFTAQDHPVRELQDTFYLDNVNGKLPKRFVKEVKDSHEKGTKGSKGWNYSWKKEDAEKVVLRTHTTCLSAQTLSKLKDEDIPGKFFALGKCFRNETMDWSHLFEFNQTEGIVIDPNANFKHLLGYLKQFFKKMGYEDARFRPAFFPYTEPSVEIDVLHPEKKEWVELGGAGIFRPEVVVPLIGKDIPVLAWGPGFDRIIMEYYSLKDLRDMYSNNIDKLRKSRLWTKCQA